jgi:hypothetical protein
MVAALKAPQAVTREMCPFQSMFAECNAAPIDTKETQPALA